MYDQFDDKLSNRVRDVFENYEDDSADMGWAELRKRFPGEKERKPVVVWWWQSAAAVLVLTLGTWAYFTKSPEKIYLTGKPKITTPIIEDSFEKELENIEVESETIPPSIPSELRVTNTNTFGSYSNSKKHSLQVNNSTLANNTDNQTSYLNSIVPDNKDRTVVLKQEQQVVSIITGESEDEVPETKPSAVESGHSSNTLEKMIVEDMLQKRTTRKPALASLDSKKENPVSSKSTAKKEKPLSIELFAGSYLNYGNGSESSINTGVGILSEIGITRKLKLSTGISLAQKTLKYNDNSIPQSTASEVISSLTAATEAEELPLQNNPGFANLAAPSAPNTTYNLNQFDASLLGLDIPINLKYTLLQNKNQLYFTAGVSSNFFIEESYSYSYQVQKGAIKSDMQLQQEMATTKFKNFDFARMLNFSLGFGRPVGKNNHLSFEPFVKYPLAGQGARDLRFGAAGMNLKLNFSKTR